MLFTLHQHIKQIEQLGNQFNELSYDEDYEFETLEIAAQTLIIDYLIAHNIRFGNIDWDAFIDEYQVEGFANVSDTIFEIQDYVIGTEQAYAAQIPLEVYALYYAQEQAFHYPGFQSAKKRVYVDMDNVLVDFPSAFPKVDPALLQQYEHDKDEIPGIFSLMDPLPGAISAMEWLYKHYDVYLLSTAPFANASAWSDKLLWVQQHLPIVGYKRLILSHHKHLCEGEYLIDDRKRNGVLRFKGEHIHFGTDAFSDWSSVLYFFEQQFKHS